MPFKPSLVVIAVICLLQGCSYFQFPGIHKVEVQQGNIITQDMVDQLRPGMTKSQARYIMGTPIIADTFNQDRWDYFYSLKKKGKRERRESVTLFFSDGKLSRISGDYLPGGAAVEGAPAEE